jgi:hypothetical protein
MKSVPLKVSIFAWGFMANRLPTKDNLFKREIVNVDSQFCTLVCGFEEFLSHLFFVCKSSHKVWCAELWLRTQGVSPNIVLAHALAFSGLRVYFLKIKNSFKVI